MDNLDRKFSAINSYVKYTTEWFEKKSWQFFISLLLFRMCYQYMIMKSWKTTAINNIELPVTRYTYRVSLTSVLLTDNRNKGLSVALYTKSLSLVCNKRKKKCRVQKGRKKPLQTRCNLVLGVSFAWGFTSPLNEIYNNKEMIKTCILLNIPTRGLKWSTCNLSLQYPFTIQQTGSENIQLYQVEVFILIKHQILATNSHGSVRQLDQTNGADCRNDQEQFCIEFCQLSHTIFHILSHPSAQSCYKLIFSSLKFSVAIRKS